MEMNLPSNLVVDENAKGSRIDRFLVEYFPDFSRSFWQKKIKSGEVLVNRKQANPHYSLNSGDSILFRFQKEASSLIPENIPLSIVFEDENYAVIDKPAGLVVHPGSGQKTHTLVHGLLHHYGMKLSTTAGEGRLGIVHRLDKDTSGLLIVAKSNAAHRFLAEQFEKREVRKEYKALVVGHVHPKKASIEAPLTRHAKHRQTIVVSANLKSRYALTHYEVERFYEMPISCSLLNVRIETGRTHQIRVHLKSIDHPVVADPIYGIESVNAAARDFGLHRQFLHAQKLSFVSPTTKKRVHFESKLPNDLENFLKNFS